jgi:hypothetical protein
VTLLLYLDENVSRTLHLLLLAAGHDVLAADLIGAKGLSDAWHLRYARRAGRVLITYNNRDFRLLRETVTYWAQDWGIDLARRHAGILVIPEPGFLTNAEAARLIEQLAAAEQSLANRLFIYKAKVGWTETV